MKLYNTLTKKVETLDPQAKPEIKVYTCGPTVYDYTHIGHWFTYIRTDILIRTLRANGLMPKWVMNVTDVGHLVSDADEGEDKLQKGAQREGKTAWEVAKFYEKDFVDGLQALNISKPDVMPRATDHIDEQIELIKALESKGYVYVIDDGVYFETAKFPKYADFAQLELDAQQAGARVAVNSQKKSPWDFALWKFSPKDSKRDMEWDSPWGKGFPGWHIECSAMSMKYLGETLDIHTGGIDHIPVHHTNEIAQSEAATNKQFARHWMHNNHVLVGGEKISKSLGNGISLQDILQRSITPEAIRLHVLESHYRSQARFSWENLEAASNRLKELHALAVLRYQAPDTVSDADDFAMEEVPQQMAAILAEDLNTPQALAYLSKVTVQLLAELVGKNMVSNFEKMLTGIDELLGLQLMSVPDITNEQKELINQREEARKAEDWAKSDELRETLQTQKIGIRDTSQGAIWFWL